MMNIFVIGVSSGFGELIVSDFVLVGYCVVGIVCDL